MAHKQHAKFLLKLFHFRYASAKNDDFDAIWDAAQAFNHDYKVKSWIIHHDVRKPKNSQ